MTMAQSPQKLNYQAVVRGANGNPITNTSISVRLSILQGSSTGSPVCVEEFSPVTNAYGLVTLEIGSVNIGEFEAIDWSAGPYYLKVEVDESGGNVYTEIGISHLLSVPYALHAETAGRTTGDSLWKQSDGNIYFDNGNVGIKVENPEASLHVNGSIKTFSGSGTVLYGMTNPFGVPDGDGFRIRWEQDWRGQQYRDALVFEKTDFNSDAPDGLMAFVNTGVNGEVDPALVIRGNGSVGVGTDSPAGKLGVETESTWSDEVPLFEVKNKDGIPVFAVYNNGVKILIEDDLITKGPKGGFAIGGFDRTKGAVSTVDFMRITPDSIRFNINNEPSKGPKGGFAIGGFDRTKGVVNEDFMYITPQSSDAGRYNAFIGYRAGYNNTGNYNSFMGYYAGYNNTSGSYNTLLGYQAGFSNQTGSNNVLIGYKAGYKGDQNVFIGNNTGRSNTTGNSNVAIGYQSGFNNSTGSNNVFIGNQCGWYNTSGSNNTFIGWKTGLHNEDGTRNVFLGESAGSANRSGSNNVFLGFEAGRSNLTGNSNVFIGRRTGLFTTDGSNNVFIGLEAGLSNTAGIDNSIIGHQAGYYNTTGHDNVFFGYKAGLHNTTAKNNVFLGSGAGSANRDGEGNVFVGFEAGRSNLHGSYNVFIGRYAGLNELGDQKLYIDNYWTSSPLIYGDFSANLLRVNGNLQYTGSLSHYSDIRMKNNITVIENVLGKINDFRGVFFDWDMNETGEMVLGQGRQIGVIAQEVEKVFPELVSENEEGYKMVDYVKLTPILLQAVKEQQLKIEELESRVCRNEDLESRITLLEQMLMEMAEGSH